MMLCAATRSNPQIPDSLRFCATCKSSSTGHIEGAQVHRSTMADAADTSNVIVRPPIAWALAVLAELALNWLMPLPFLATAVSAGWLGTIVFALALALIAWAISAMTRAGSNVPTRLPTTTILETGPHRFSRHPIYPRLVLGPYGRAV